MSKTTKKNTPDGLDWFFEAHQPAAFFTPQTDEVEEPTKNGKSAAERFIEKSEQISDVVDELEENVYRWNQLTVEVDRRSMLSEEDPTRLDFSQEIKATKDNGDQIIVSVNASSWFDDNHLRHKVNVSTCGLKAKANWSIKASLGGISKEFHESKVTLKYSRGTSIHSLLDSDPRISRYFLSGVNKDIVGMKQIHKSFEKIKPFMTEEEQ